MEEEFHGRGLALASLLEDLAFVYGEQGKTSRAEAAYRKAIDLIVAAVGKEHLEYAVCLANLGDQLRGQGKLDEAEKSLREAMDVFGRLSAQNSWQFGFTARNLAFVLVARGGKAEEALKLLEQSRLILGAKLDDVTLENAILLLGEAQAQRQLKDFTAADTAARKALAIRRELFGQRNPNTLEAVDRTKEIDYDWYNAYVRSRKFEDARKVLGQIVELLTTYYGGDYWRTTDARDDAACLEKFTRFTDEQRRRSDESLEAVGKADKLLSVAADCEKAIPLLEATIKAREELYGPRDAYIVRLLYGLGKAQGALGHPNLAEPLLHRAADRYREVYGVRRRPPIVCDLLFLLANIHEERGDFASAAPLLADARVVEKETAGSATDAFCDYTLELSRALIETGEFEKAQALLDENLVRQEQIGGKQGAGYGQTLHVLFVLHSRNSDVQQGEAYFHQADKILRDLNPTGLTWFQLEQHVDWGVFLATFGSDPKVAVQELEWARTQITTSTDRSFVRLHQLHLRCLRGLARAYERSGDFDKEEAVLREVLDSQHKRFPGFLPAYQNDANRLALLLDYRAGQALQAGKLDEYVASFQKGMDIWTEIFGSDYWLTRNFRSRLNVAQKVAALNDEQRKRYRAALADAEKLKGTTSKGREAVEVGQRALAAFEELIGTDNVVYQWTVSNLVLAHIFAREYATASERNRKLLVAAQGLVGPNGDLVGWAHCRFAQIESFQGHYKAALIPYLRCVATLRKAEGDHFGMCGVFLYFLGDTALKNGSLRSGELALRKAHLILSQCQADMPADYVNCLLSYGRACWDLDDDERAEVLFRRAYSVSARVLGEASESSADCAERLGDFYIHQHAYKKAEPLLREAMEKRRRLFGERSESCASAIESLANLLRDQGDVLLPGPLYQQVLDIYTAKNGPESVGVARVLRERGQMHLARGDFEAAQTDFDRAQAITEKGQGTRSGAYGACVASLADLAFQRGNKDHAAELYGEYLGRCRRNASYLAAIQGETQQLERARRFREVLGWYLSLDPEGESLERAYGDVLAWKGSVFAHQRGLRSGLANKTAKSDCVSGIVPSMGKAD